jgi:hypothetical protein
MMLPRLKRIEKSIIEKSDPDEYAKKLREMSDEELELEYNQCREETKDWLGISTEEEMQNYESLLLKWDETEMTEDALKELERYENKLLRKKERMKHSSNTKK